MGVAAAVVAGVAAVATIAATAIEVSAAEEAAEEERKALGEAKEEAKGISELSRKDQLKRDRESVRLREKEIRGVERQRAFQRKMTLSADQRNRVSELANIVNNAAAEDSVFRNVIRGRK